MAITINGNGTITGYTPVPDGSITSAKLASGVGGKILQVQSTQKQILIRVLIIKQIFRAQIKTATVLFGV